MPGSPSSRPGGTGGAPAGRRSRPQPADVRLYELAKESAARLAARQKAMELMEASAHSNPGGRPLSKNRRGGESAADLGQRTLEAQRERLGRLERARELQRAQEEAADEARQAVRHRRPLAQARGCRLPSAVCLCLSDCLFFFTCSSAWCRLSLIPLPRTPIAGGGGGSGGAAERAEGISRLAAGLGGAARAGWHAELFVCLHFRRNVPRRTGPVQAMEHNTDASVCA